MPLVHFQFQFTPLREGRPAAKMKASKQGLFQFTPLREGRRVTGFLLAKETHFNSRPSARGDFADVRHIPSSFYFNSRPSARGDPSATQYFAVRKAAFQFTPLREGRRQLFRSSTLLSQFQFTPLREGRQNCNWKCTGVPNFNSRPSARGDAARCPQLYCEIFISIHAPPRGATQ